MKRRWFVVALALPATLTIAGVLLYARDVEWEPEHVPMVPIVISNVDIPAGTDLDQLIRDDQFRLIEVPLVIVDDGTVTSADQLRHKRARVAILTGELIQASRLKTEAVRASS